MTLTIEDIQQMTVPERLDLIGSLWDSIDHLQNPVPLSEEMRAELDRRLESLERHPENVISWEDLKAELRCPR